MEGFEGIVFIIMIVLALVSGKNKKKKISQKRQAQARAMKSAFNETKKHMPLPVRDLAEEAEARLLEVQEQIAAQTLPSGPAQPKPKTVESAVKPKEAVLPKRPEGPDRPRMKAAAPTVRPAEHVVTDRKLPGLTDDEGCIGGSLAHTAHEGESRVEHDRHLSRSAATEQTGTAVLPRRIRADELRRAVIMSEILDKPKALRR